MNSFEQERRSFLFSIGAFGMSQVLPQRMIGAEAEARQGSGAAKLVVIPVGASPTDRRIQRLS